MRARASCCGKQTYVLRARVPIHPIRNPALDGHSGPPMSERHLACTTASRANGTRWSNVAERTSRSYARPAAGGTITPGTNCSRRCAKRPARAARGRGLQALTRAKRAAPNSRSQPRPTISSNRSHCSRPVSARSRKVEAGLRNHAPTKRLDHDATELPASWSTVALR